MTQPDGAHKGLSGGNALLGSPGRRLGGVMRNGMMVGALAMLMAGSALAKEPVPLFKPKPAWVEDVALPAPDPARKSAPMQILLTNSQQRFTKDGSVQFVRYAAMPQTVVGLQGAGTVSVPWLAERYDLQIHWIDIIRNGQRISQIRPDDLVVLRREENLEKAMLDGVRTVVSPVRGLKIGDTVDVAFSYIARDRLVGSRPEDIFPARPPYPMVKIDQRIVVDNELGARWTVPEGMPSPSVRKEGAFSEHRLVRTKLAPLDLPDDVPDRFRKPIMQFTTYPSWSSVAEELRPLFDNARSLKDGSTLLPEVRKLAAATSDKAQQMMMALQLAQDEVRYVALLLGEGAYKPQTADDTWELRFGDCKGKTVMMLAMLRELGIEAEPLLVSTRYDDRLAGSLPSLSIFDHVIVRARLDGKTYYLDATDYGQRALADVAGSSFRTGLPLVPDAKLVALDPLPLDRPSKDITLEWDRRTGEDDAIAFKSTVTLTGWRAAELRAKLANAESEEKFGETLKSLMPVIDNDDLEVLGYEPVTTDGAFTITYRGKAAMDWAPFEGEKETRFGFSESVTRWKPDFERDEDKGGDLPFEVNKRPYWERLQETVLLPNGGNGFKVEADPIDANVAGVTIKRSVSKQGERVTSVSEIRNPIREVEAKDAKAAEEALEKLDKQNAWIVGPREKKKKKSA